MQEEIWKQVLDFEGYEVSNLGRVRSYWKQIARRLGGGFNSVLKSDPQRILKQQLDRKGYPCVTLRRNKKIHNKKVHSLVIVSFRGPPPPGHECKHLDGTTTNTHLINLCWGTKKANEADKIVHGTKCFGETNGLTKLTAGQVLQIRDLYRQGLSQEKIGKMFSISRPNIGAIVRQQTWKHLL